MSHYAQTPPIVSFEDIVLYLRVFPETLVPPLELPPLIWGMAVDETRPCADWPAMPRRHANETWVGLSAEERVATATRVLATGVHPSAVAGFLGGANRALFQGLAGSGGRRGRRASARQVFRAPASAAHANAFLDALRLQLYSDLPTAKEFLIGFALAWSAYDAVVDIDYLRLDVDAAFAVAVSAMSGEIVQLPCHASRCWYYAHRDFRRGIAPWMSTGARSLTIADRVRFFLLYYVPEEERPRFTREEIATARQIMQSGSARWRR